MMKYKLVMIIMALLLALPLSLAVLNDAEWYMSADVDARDLSGNLHTGTVTGATQTAAGCKLGGGCYSFDGVGDEITLNNSNALNNTDFTVGGWFKFDAFASDRFLIGKWDGSGKDWYVDAGSGGAAILCRRNDNGDSEHSAFFTHSMSTAEWYFIVCVFNQTSNSIQLYVNATFQDDNTDVFTPKRVANSVYMGERYDGNFDFAGDMDEMFFYDRALTFSEISALYNSDLGNNPYVSILDENVNIFVNDTYDNSSIVGANVTLWNDTHVFSNVTNANGLAHFGLGGSFNVNITHPAYFDTYPSSNATNGTPQSFDMLGAFVSINAFDLVNVSVDNFNMTSFEQANSTSGLFARIVLKPNASNQITVIGEGYQPLVKSIDVGLRDTGNYTLQGVYESLLNVTASSVDGVVSNFSANLTGVVNSTSSTTSGQVNVGVMFGNYSLFVNSSLYSTALVNVTIASGNTTPHVDVMLFNLNTFNLTFIDETTEDLISEEITIEVISDIFSGNFTTSSGRINISFLTPADYTIRYRGVNWTERDYYQNLTPQSFFDLTLYAIRIADADTVTATVVDTAGVPVEGATVKLLRYFVSCNCYQVVEMDRTSYAGVGHVSVEPEIGFYRWIIEYEGVTRFQSVNPENFYTNTRTFTINLGDDIYESFRGLSGLGHTLTVNRATETIAFTWNDPEGLVIEGCLDAEYLVGIEYVSVGENCADGTAGSVLVSIPDMNNTRYRYTAYVDTSTQFSIATLYSGYTELVNDFDFQQYGLFIGLGITVSLALFFSFSASAMIIITIIGVALMKLLGFMDLTMTFITGAATLALGLTLYLMRR